VSDLAIVTADNLANLGKAQLPLSESFALQPRRFRKSGCVAKIFFSATASGRKVPHVIHGTPARGTAGLDFCPSDHCERPLRGNPAAVPRNCRVLDGAGSESFAALASGGFVRNSVIEPLPSECPLCLLRPSWALSIMALWLQAKHRAKNHGGGMYQVLYASLASEKAGLSKPPAFSLR